MCISGHKINVQYWVAHKNALWDLIIKVVLKVWYMPVNRWTTDNHHVEVSAETNQFQKLFNFKTNMQNKYGKVKCMKFIFIC